MDSALAQHQPSAQALSPRFLPAGVREAGHPGTLVAASGRSSADRPLPDQEVRPPHLPPKPAYRRAHTPLAGEEIRIRKELFPFSNAGLDSEPAPPGVDSRSDHLGLCRPASFSPGPAQRSGFQRSRVNPDPQRAQPLPASFWDRPGMSLKVWPGGPDCPHLFIAGRLWGLPVSDLPTGTF